MHFHDTRWRVAGKEVQPVGVLRDEGVQPAPPLQLDESTVGGSRLSAPDRGREPRPPGRSPDLAVFEVVAQRSHPLRARVASPDSVRPTEVGNAGIGRDTGSGEHDDRSGAGDERRPAGERLRIRSFDDHVPQVRAGEPVASHAVERKVTEYCVADRVATITLKRPERLNAWTGRMSLEYRTALAEAAADEGVRVIVVTGAGRGFCAGADSEALAGHLERGGYSDGLPADPPTPGYGARAEFDADLAYHLGIEKPVIAAVNGPAAGLGFALMCYCDVRIAAAGAKLTSAHGKLGLPAEFGLSWMLPRLIGLSRAVDILLSSRIFLAEEAQTMGLVSAVVPASELSAHVGSYAVALATEVSSASMAVTKRQLYRDLLAAGGPAASIADAEVTMSSMMQAADYREGVAALREKRLPRF
jgi:enoyl-CoA hydratase/carnithine racemase